MAVDDVARVLMTLDDAAFRERVVSGDSEALSGFDLTPEELELVAAAVTDQNDVAAFSLQGEQAATSQAVDYVRGNIQDPKLAEGFGNWLVSARDRPYQWGCY